MWGEVVNWLVKIHGKSEGGEGEWEVVNRMIKHCTKCDFSERRWEVINGLVEIRAHNKREER